MDLHYSVFVHIDLFEVVPKRGLQRQRVMEFVRSLSNNPFTLGDFTDKDNALHTRQIKVVGDFAITELARMLGGQSDAAKKHAEALLK